MNNINVQIDQCYQQLLQVINQSQLPVGCVYFILKDINHEIEQQYNDFVRYQINTTQEETQEEE